jgi:hypothetical protein
MLSSGVKQLRRPEIYRVELSAAVTALRDSLDNKGRASSPPRTV